MCWRYAWHHCVWTTGNPLPHLKCCKVGLVNPISDFQPYCLRSCRCWSGSRWRFLWSWGREGEGGVRRRKTVSLLLPTNIINLLHLPSFVVNSHMSPYAFGNPKILAEFPLLIHCKQITQTSMRLVRYMERTWGFHRSTWVVPSIVVLFLYVPVTLSFKHLIKIIPEHPPV